MNVRLSGFAVSRLRSPATTVFLFETQGGWNLNGGPELMLTQPRHIQGVNVVFADFHAETVKPEALKSLRWNP